MLQLRYVLKVDIPSDAFDLPDVPQDTAERVIEKTLNDVFDDVVLDIREDLYEETGVLPLVGIDFWPEPDRTVPQT